MKRTLLSIALATFFAGAFAQTIDRCGTMQNLEMLKQQDPGLEKRMHEIDNQIENAVLANPANKTSNVIITIPVVVHVVYNGAAQNISDAFITSQLDVLNEDYGATNADKLKVPPYYRNRIGSTEIRFKLASRDPNGNPTNGILRVPTTVTSFSTNNAVKYTAQGGDNAWPSTSYLNLWVCNLGGGVLGYAQFPGGAAATDGVVILYSAMGRVTSGSPYNLGRTATHEVGHWLNLKHIWGDSNCGNDNVSDTPTSQTANYGVPCQQVTCSNGPFGDMYMDYMDYVDDAAMQMFTNGQVVRMNTVINGVRASLKTSLGCTAPSLNVDDASISEIVSPVYSPCTNTNLSFIPEVKLTNAGSAALTSCTINYKVDNGTVQTYSWTGNLASLASVNVALPSMTANSGDRYFYAYTTNPNGGADANPANDRISGRFYVKAANAALPLVQSFTSTTFPPTAWTSKKYDCTTGWVRTTTAFASSPAAMYFNNFTQTATNSGRIFDLITQPINISAAATPTLTFNVAYAQRTGSITDTLEVLISTDCGYTFTSVFKKFGTALETAPAQATAFTPTANQWRNESVNLSAYASATNAILVFRNTTKAGNNVYVDDISVDQLQGINTIDLTADVSVYPNPTNGLFNINFSNTNQTDYTVSVVNALGETVISKMNVSAGSQSATVDLSGKTKGLYFVLISGEKGNVVKKITLN